MFGFGLLMTKIGGDKRSHKSLGAPWLHFFFSLFFDLDSSRPGFVFGGKR